MDQQDTLDRALALCDHCGCCGRSGQVTIFHRLYRGLPWITLTKRNGDPYKFHVQAVAFCNCLIGRWYQRHNTEHDVRPSLEAALARPGWGLTNPTTPDLPPDVASGNWRNFHRWLIAQHKGKSVVQPLPKQPPAKPAIAGDPILEAAKRPPTPAEPLHG